MMVLACSSIILAGILTSYIYLIRGFAAVSNYTEIHQQAGYAVAVFSKELRGASGVKAPFSASSLTVTVPTSFTVAGKAAGSNNVTYVFTNSALWRIDSSVCSTGLLATNVINAVFALYGTNGVALASNTVVGAKGVQLDLNLRKYVVSQANSEEFRSARVCMRNTP
jgi:hypothetical protein